MVPSITRFLRLGMGCAWSCAIGTALQAQASAPVVSIASLRVRHETWSWFDGSAAGQYSFVGLHARLGAMQNRAMLGWRVELASPALLGLPVDAVQSAPSGQLGLGGTYAAVNGMRRDAVGLWLKQATLRLGREGRVGTALRLGRFEFSDGAEWSPADPTLARVRQQRIAQRLIGPFGFTHGQRSFDGAQLQVNRDRHSFTFAAFQPTGGVFTVDGGRSLDVRVAYAAFNAEVALARRPSDIRLFAIHFDDRRGTVPVDARPLSVRTSSSRRVETTTLGAHIVQRYGTPERPVDVLGWGAWQGGTWSNLRHAASAFAAEVGWRDLTRAAQPGIRIALFHSTGDDNPSDGTHGTFHQMLPTPRVYALFPFHNLQNTQEASLGADIRLRPSVTLRASAHRLRLTAASDLWTLGGGAFDDAAFGFAGRPSGGVRELGSAVTLSLAWQAARQVQLELFAARASGGDVMAATYGNRHPAHLVYLETTVRR